MDFLRLSKIRRPSRQRKQRMRNYSMEGPLTRTYHGTKFSRVTDKPPSQKSLRNNHHRTLTMYILILTPETEVFPWGSVRRGYCSVGCTSIRIPNFQEKSNDLIGSAAYICNKCIGIDTRRPRSPPGTTT